MQEQHYILPHSATRKLRRLALRDRKLLNLCYSFKEQHIPFSLPTIPFAGTPADTSSPRRSADEWLVARQLFKPNEQHNFTAMTMDLDGKTLSALSSHTPDARPTLSVDTFWSTCNGQVIPIRALIDTGCNTSLFLSTMLSLVTDSSGTPFSSEVIPTATLTAASGNAIKLTQSTHLTFQIGETDVSHSFYLLDSLPIAEKMILGMDFLVKHQAWIDVADGSITLRQVPTDNSRLRCLLAEDVRLHPGMALCVALVAEPHLDIPDCGYLQGVDDLPDGCLLWHGVQQRRNGQVSAYVSNQSSHDITLKASTQVAWWEPDVHGEVAMGDRLVAAAQRGRPEPSPTMTISSLTIADNGDDWEWAGDHLYLDLSRTPIGEQDPSVDASVQQLKEFWEQTKVKLDAVDEKAEDACADKRRLLQQLDRINTRIMRYD